jgi:hypothetical protein
LEESLTNGDPDAVDLYFLSNSGLPASLEVLQYGVIDASWVELPRDEPRSIFHALYCCMNLVSRADALTASVRKEKEKAFPLRAKRPDLSFIGLGSLVKGSEFPGKAMG